ncbi:MAG: glycoside hydrolase family 2 protein, partial [Anaerolineae bacterium]|nr:glycoside hydrolase family 2 protein [Anaerolineae bacterium]
ASPHTPYDDRRDWNDPRWGDAHIWDVWHGMKPFEFYYTCFHRFNSEFGFQSFPEPQMVRTYTQPEDENITSYIMEYHQRSPSGNSIIMHYLLDWFRLPTSFENTLWLSQILQGMSVKHAVEHWRRTMPRGMGTLYWQLNDCWPVASWSSLDYNGRWKALHHMARHFYAPLLVSGVANLEDGTVAVHVTNDHLQEVAGVVGWEVTTAQGERVAEGEETAVIAPNQNNPITTVDLQSVLAQYGKRDLLVWLTLHVDGAIVSENLALFARPKHLSLPDPEILCAIEEIGNASTEHGRSGRYQITLSSDQPALWVWLEAQDGIQVSDNFFHLRPGTSHVIRLTLSDRELPITAIINSINVRSLVDTYQ